MLYTEEKRREFLEAFEKEISAMSDEEFFSFFSDSLEDEENSFAVSMPKEYQANPHWQFQDQPSHQNFNTQTSCLPQKEATFF
jgi:hypothetical protein